jgi:hypothetical protein
LFRSRQEKTVLKGRFLKKILFEGKFKNTVPAVSNGMNLRKDNLREGLGYCLIQKIRRN